MSARPVSKVACTCEVPDVIPTTPPVSTGVGGPPVTIHGAAFTFRSGVCDVSEPVPVKVSVTSTSVGNAAVVKDHTGLGVDPLAFRAVTRQKYVVPPVRVGM